MKMNSLTNTAEAPRLLLHTTYTMTMSNNLNFHVASFFTCLILSLSVSSAFFFPTVPRVGFYDYTCPSAQSIIQRAVNKAVSANPGLAAGLIRMHFHDCFVRGCDASVLLDSTPGNIAEKDHPANKGSLRGFEVIYAAKADLEIACPGIVSCADILAFAARDSSYKVGKIFYQVPAGRRDGRVSLVNDVTQNLPPPSLNAQQLEANFARKKLSLDEMVTLSGAHSIGIAHCTSFASRLSPLDPTLDPVYAAYLTTICSPPLVSLSNTSSNPTAALDVTTPNKLDNKYYVNLKQHRGLLTSDQTLYTNSTTAKIVEFNAKYGSIWAAKYAAAMVKMGQIELTKAPQGEIRRKCNIRN